MSKFTIANPEALFAAVLCASTEETRYYLNGVCLDATQSTPYAVATDGHRLARIKLDVAEVLEPVNGTRYGIPNTLPIVSADCLAKIKKLAKAPRRQGNSAGFYPLDFDLDAGTVTVNETVLKLELIDGTFPDWRRIMPTIDGTIESVAFNADFLATMAGIGNLLNCSKVWTIEGTDTTRKPGGACQWRYKSDMADALYVVMPMRS